MKRKLIILVSVFLGLYVILFFYREYKIKSRAYFISSISLCSNLKVEKYKVFSLSDLGCGDGRRPRERLGVCPHVVVRAERGDAPDVAHPHPSPAPGVDQVLAEGRPVGVRPHRASQQPR